MTSLAHDRYVLDHSEGQEPTEHIVRKKTFIDIADSNQGSYTSGQVIYNLSQLQHSSQYLDVKSSYLQVPISINVTTDHAAGLTIANAQFPVMLKSGIQNLINSCELYVGNQQILSNQQMSLVPITYKLMSAYTSDALNIHGDTIHMYDTTNEFTSFDNTVGLVHHSNNHRNVDHIPDLTNDTDSFLDKAAWARLRNDYWERVTADNKHVRLNINATIPLEFLHYEFFSKLPLVKGAMLRMTLTLNAPSSCTWAAGEGTILERKPTVVTPTGVLPFMLNLGFAGGDVTADLASAGAITVSCQVGNRESPTTSIRCAMYELTPSVERSLISSPVKPLVFNDVLSYQNLTVERGNSASQHQITSGLARATGMLILPFPTRAANKDLSPFASPYCNCPTTVLPGSSITNFQVFVSGAPLFAQNIQYGWQQWMEHVKFFAGTDGNPIGALGELHSGLVSQKSWRKSPFIFVNLQNRTDEEFPIVRSYAVSFDNLSKFDCQYAIFLFYEKSFQLEVTTGQVVLNV